MDDLTLNSTVLNNIIKLRDIFQQPESSQQIDDARKSPILHFEVENNAQMVILDSDLCPKDGQENLELNVLETATENIVTDTSNHILLEDSSAKNETKNNSSYYCRESYRTIKGSAFRTPKNNGEFTQSIGSSLMSRMNECSEVKKHNLTNSTDNGISQFLEKSIAVESNSSRKKQPKIAFFDATKLASSTTDRESSDKLKQLEDENNSLKQQIERLSKKYQNLATQMKEKEEDAIKANSSLKKLEEELKSHKSSSSVLQKKLTALEKVSQELSTSLRACEIDKMTYFDKYQTLSKRLKTENKYKTICKDLEAELASKSKDMQKNNDRLRVLEYELKSSKQNEENCKKKLKEQIQLAKDLQNKIDVCSQERDFLLNSNIDLLTKHHTMQSVEGTHGPTVSICESDILTKQNNCSQEFLSINKKSDAQKSDLLKPSEDADHNDLISIAAKSEKFNLSVNKRDPQNKISRFEDQMSMSSSPSALNDTTDKYDNLMMSHYKVLERVINLEKVLSQRQDTDFSNGAILSVRTNNAVDSDTDRQSNNELPPAYKESTIFDGLNGLQQALITSDQAATNTLAEKLSYNLRSKFQDVRLTDDDGLRSKSLDKYRISRDILKTEESDARIQTTSQDRRPQGSKRKDHKLSSISFADGHSHSREDSAESRGSVKSGSYYEIHKRTGKICKIEQKKQTS